MDTGHLDSIADVQAHLTQLEADIERQQLVLHNLKQTRLEVLHQLNALRDPIARLPLEISSRIFAHCAPATICEPLVLLHVCHRWTQIALFSTDLWAVRICFWTPIKIGHFNLLREWLFRAKTAPLTFFLRDHPSAVCLQRFSSLIAPHASHIREFSLDSRCYLDTKLFGPRAHYSALERVHVSSIGHTEDPVSMKADQIFRVLRAAPLLKAFIVDASYMRQSSIDSNIRHRHEHLTTLTTRLAWFSSLLPHLTLPSLRHLEMRLHSSNDLTILTSFLTRSAPPLRTLALWDVVQNNFGTPREAIQRLLDSIPHLTRLRIVRGFPLDNLLIEILTVNPNALPNLADFMIQLRSKNTPDWYSDVLRMLSALSERGTMFKRFWVELANRDSDGEADDVFQLTPNDRDVLEDLRGKGIRIDFGL
ncbi:hypothetical protein R3P38DRAFT_3042563 [Favolaschia claudopus]|uniref:F-box domain-containing protein n=1 Tax=Favolaschia claudopus TaxID=2862362 RepID=A0AAW0A844_9AGAR